jgi:malate dehydrogenase
MSKVIILGAGSLGTATLARLAERDLGELVLVDGDGARARARALDAATAAGVSGHAGRVTGSDDWRDAAGAAVAVIAEGDAAALRTAATALAEHCPRAVTVVAAQPVEAMTDLVTFTTLFPRGRVIGVGSAIDSARFRTLVATELGVPAGDVWALVVGEHGDTMVPLVSSASVAGTALEDLLSSERLDELARRVRDRGDGDDDQARAAAAAATVEAIVRDRREVTCCCLLCEGELGLERVCLGVPVRLGRAGVEEIVAVPMSEDERAALERSAAVVRERVAALLGAG